ncbi:unnamed protein product [Thelazia callipaeda]|uniref:BRO1 domain-containing protein n=1 Tax=Thelazia callipaeda TaxID=103827 RepID=A0A0N5DB89_THECL|nr:unnamed protein product [Thelazia callipaeda]
MAIVSLPEKFSCAITLEDLKNSDARGTGTRDKEAQVREINQTKWTRKITSESVDPLILGAVNQAAREHAIRNPPMTDIASQLQAAQQYYKDIDVAMRKLLADNELRTVTQIQGVKEQAMLNLAVCKDHANELHTTWYDIKKACDSVTNI